MTKQEISNILTVVRAKLLLREPFYGRLLMNLKFGIASCKTACTDMRRILWDPEFISGLNEEEIEFIMEHEVMHCALQHPLRGRGLNKRLYNIAADIVVNGNIFYSRGIDNFKDCRERSDAFGAGYEPGIFTFDRADLCHAF